MFGTIFHVILFSFRVLYSDGFKKETCTHRTAEDQQKHTLPQAPEPGQYN
jgi:hypothetical protein